MKDRYFKYLAAAIIAGVVLAIFSPGPATEPAPARSDSTVVSGSP